MFLDKLIYELTFSQQHRSLYHFTDLRNIATIDRFGILSKDQLTLRGIVPPAPGGNSWDWDRKIGISDYVSLCFTNEHPMCYSAKNDGRIDDVRYLKINPRIIRQKGVFFCAGVANKKGAVIMPISDAEPHCDLEVIYKWVDWRDRSTLERVKIARKYEILVPKIVGRDLISGI